MHVERFARGVINSGVLDFYIAMTFFATVIFFVLNVHLYTPMEILLWTFIVTVGAKGFANLMLGLLISLYDLSKVEEKNNFNQESEKINQMISELKLQEIEKSNNKQS